MPTELVILSETAVTAESLVRAVAPVMPDARYVGYGGEEIHQFVDVAGAGVLSVFASRPVTVPREAAAALLDPPGRFSLWTDLAVSYGDSTVGRRLAEAIAAAHSGSVYERR